MKIPFSIVLEWLQQYKCDFFKTDNSSSFRAVHLLPDSIDDMRNDVLYVGYLSDATKNNMHTHEYTYICVNDQFSDYSELNEILPRAIIIENIALSDLFNSLQNLFEKYNDWEHQMYECLMKDDALQSILDISENFCGNHISITDSIFRLIAYTKNITCDDSVAVKLITNGFHDAETLTLFKETGRLKQWEEAGDNMYSSWSSFSKYPVYVITINNGDNFIQMVMHCHNKKPSDATKDRFDILTKFVSLLLMKDQVTKKGWYNYSASSFFYSLLEGDSDAAQIEQLAKLYDIPLTGEFDLFKLSLEGIEKFQLDRLYIDVSSCLPNSKVVIYQNGVFVVNSYLQKKSNPSEELIDTNAYLERIHDILERFDANCGVSSRFKYMMDFPIAYSQAIAAISIGKELRDKGEKIGRIIEYENICILEILSQKSSDSNFGISKFVKVLTKLHESDLKSDRDWFNFFYQYLLYERSPSKTATKLTMHKNNVIYRVSKIEELVQLDLNDPEVRLKLLLAYKYLYLVDPKMFNE